MARRLRASYVYFSSQRHTAPSSVTHYSEIQVLFQAHHSVVLRNRVARGRMDPRYPLHRGSVEGRRQGGRVQYLVETKRVVKVAGNKHVGMQLLRKVGRMGAAAAISEGLP